MKRALIIVGIVAALVVVLTLVAVLLGPDRTELDQAVRDASGSAFIELSEGFTEYEVAGPVNGPPVVLIHGLSVPMFDFDGQFTALANAGYRVLRYNQYGRGLSDRPTGRYDSRRYVLQLAEILDSQEWEQASLVGHSMGCVVAAEFAVQFPERVDRMVLISPTLHLSEGNAGMILARVPLVGDFAAKVILPGIVSSRADALFVAAGTPHAAEYSEAFRAQMKYRGFTRSAKALFRNEMVDDVTDTYRQLDGSRIRTIRGTLDESVPEEHFAVITRVVPEMDTVLLDEIGHMPTLEVPSRVANLIIEFLPRPRVLYAGL